jgi:hypothetical protein
MRLEAAIMPPEVIVNVPVPATPAIGEAPTQIESLSDKADPAPETCTELVDPPNELIYVLDANILAPFVMRSLLLLPL